MFWGSSEALDFVNLYKKHNSGEQSPDELSVLLYGCGDPRHILKTISTSYQDHFHSTKITFYVVEGVMEILARNFLLMTIALEKPKCLSLVGKTHLFLDVYGNTLIRPISYNYISSKAQHFENIITDKDFASKVAPIFDFDLMQYRERDHLQNIFHFWLNRSEHIFNISEYWDARLRATLRSRYDHRKGAFDWDLMMRLRDNGGQLIGSQEYQHWRETGIAFVFPEFEYNCPNKTLAAALTRNGTTYRHRGYVGDTTVGPYAAFGLNCADPKYLASQHGKHHYRATDVSFRNLIEIFHEIGEKRKFDDQIVDVAAYGASVLDNGKTFSKQIDSIVLQKSEDPLLEYPDVKIKFVSLDDVLKIGKNSKLRNLFDVVCVGRNYFSFVKDNTEFKSSAKDGCLFVFETIQLSTMKKEDIGEYLHEIKTYSKSINLNLLTKFTINGPYSMVIYKHSIN